MKKLVPRVISLLVLIHVGASFAQTTLWQDVTPLAKSSSDYSTSRYYDSNNRALRDLLNRVPGETSGQTETIYLPMPGGSIARFSIVESPIMEAELAAKYPDIKTYKVRGIDDPIASGRVDINDQGFHAMLQTSQGRIFIDPDGGSARSNRYLARNRDAYQPSEPFYCRVDELEINRSSQPVSFNRLVNRIPGSLLTYRLAVSATKQYADALGGGKTSAMNGIVTAINRINQIYELDLGIRLMLVNNNQDLIDDTGANSGFYEPSGAETDVISLLIENQSWTDDVLGSANYDIGHIFSTGGGGVAAFEAVCNASIKAQGSTGLPDPTGEPFYIDYLAHELGHQFGANHSFNGTTSACKSGRWGPTAFEPGSGSTIMAYAGICGGENIQSNSDATFHAGSISQINNFVTSGGGAICDSSFLISNTDPTANAGPDRIIPIETPFQLSAIFTPDPDGDTLSYQWDQMDAGSKTNNGTFGKDLVDNALFRTFVPQCANERNFPDLANEIFGIVDPSETLPTTSRDLNFRLTVRDSRTGQATDDVVLSVDDTSGPFRISSHMTSADILQSDNTELVTWNVANTNNATVSCLNVDIDLLTFSADYTSYSVTNLVSDVANDGTAIIPIPGYSNSKARFRVKCSNNIFYDISDADLNFIGGLGSFSTDQYNTSFSATNSCNSGSVIAGDQIASGGGGGSIANFGASASIVDTLWLISLLSLLLGTSLKRARFKRFRLQASLRPE